MSAQDFVHNAVVNNPHIAHSDHLLHNLNTIGMTGAWTRTGKNGETVDDYMSAWKPATDDKNREPVVTVIRGMETAHGTYPIVALYFYKGSGDSKVGDGISLSAKKDGVFVVITPFSSAPIDENNLAITFQAKEEYYDYTDFSIVALRGTTSVVCPFDPYKASSDLYRYEYDVSGQKTYVVSPIVRTVEDDGAVYTGGEVRTFVKESGLVPTNFVGSNKTVPTVDDLRISIEDETTQMSPLWYKTDCAELGQIDIGSLYTTAHHFVELSEGQLIPIEGLFENG